MDTSPTLPRQTPTSVPVEVMRVAVVDGPDVARGVSAAGDHVSVGTAEGNDLVLTDPMVSRFHLTLTCVPGGVSIVDGGSTNGTFFEGARVERCIVPFGSSVAIGQSRLRLEKGGSVEVEIVDSDSEPGLERFSARSATMRRLLAQLVKAAASEVSVLFVGASGTGKELLARALHERGPRRTGPFETVDCASLSPTLIGSELFGHEKGAFTGADRRHVGAFERAHGGTLFLDEIGELPESLQPILLGALERKRFRRLGGRDEVQVDVRIVSATHRDLRAEVNAQRFRLDLYYRLAVVRLGVPSLRERLDDLPALVELFAKESHASAQDLARLLDPSFLEPLTRHDWPGNVRELRNVVDATLAMGEPPVLSSDLSTSTPPPAPSSQPSFGPVLSLGPALEQPYKEARQLVLHEFEKAYLPRLLERANGNVSQAARDADMDRSHLWELLRRHGLR
ncbi:MAG: sigma 54-interacting transcriptional regulator [Sandaracinus sp.]